MGYCNKDLWFEEASLNVTDNGVVETNDIIKIKKNEICYPQITKQHKTNITFFDIINIYQYYFYIMFISGLS